MMRTAAISGQEAAHTLPSGVIRFMDVKRRAGDRRDGTLLRNIDSMHKLTPYLYPNRADNEAYLSERIDITNIMAYLERKNAGITEYPYNLFQVILTALMKTMVLRPQMNRFIQGKRIYQRNELTAAFVVKKQFKDDAGEALAFLRFDGESTIDSAHNAIVEEITACRSDTPDNSTASMDLVCRMPRFLLTFAMWLFRRLDYNGKVPYSLIKTDPYYASVMISNLGSIKLKSGYHHLTNWGTNSIFCIIGEKKLSPFFDENGTVIMRETVDLGLTVDERIADGYYYSKTMRLFKHLLEHPELLEAPAKEMVNFE